MIWLTGPLLCLELAYDEYLEFITKKKFKRGIRKDTEGFVYFIRIMYEGKKNIVKIGSAIDIDVRKRSIETGNPFETILIGYIKSVNFRSIEKGIHKKFSQANLRQEWYELDIEKVKMIIEEYSGVFIKLNKKN